MAEKNQMADTSRSVPSTRVGRPGGIAAAARTSSSGANSSSPKNTMRTTRVTDRRGMARSYSSIALGSTGTRESPVTNR
jgi:hypothetical protein